MNDVEYYVRFYQGFAFWTSTPRARVDSKPPYISLDAWFKAFGYDVTDHVFIDGDLFMKVIDKRLVFLGDDPKFLDDCIVAAGDTDFVQYMKALGWKCSTLKAFLMRAYYHHRVNVYQEYIHVLRHPTPQEIEDVLEWRRGYTSWSSEDRLFYNADGWSFAFDFDDPDPDFEAWKQARQAEKNRLSQIYQAF